MGQNDAEQLFLYVGLDNGILVRSLVDNIAGGISDARNQYLGSRAVRLQRIKLNTS
jgi:splicing factor 3B subunit 3